MGPSKEVVVKLPPKWQGEVSPAKVKGKRLLGRGNRQSKGSEAGMSSKSLGNEKMSVNKG